MNARLMLMVLLALLILSVFYGSQEWASPQALIEPLIWDLRLPRALTAALSGGALALAGVMTQGLFRNPLACPSILGVGTAGAFTGLLALYFLEPLLANVWLPVASSLGSILVLFFLVPAQQARHAHSTSSLLLQGMSLNAFLGAAISALLTLAWQTPDRGQGMTHWLVGGFAGSSWPGVIALSCAMIFCLLIARSLGAQLDILSLGGASAQALGVSLGHLQRRTILGVGLLMGATVAIVGPIPFVGLLVPHFCRSLGLIQHDRLIPASLSIGASFTLLMDLLARNAAYPREIEAGVLISLFGGGVFYWLCRRSTF